MKIPQVPVLIFAVLFFSTASMAQPGRYAGAGFRKMINTSFTDERAIPGLEGFDLYESTLLNRLDAPERLFLNVYAKGSERVVLFTVLADTVSFNFKILDVLYIKKVGNELEFRSVTCRKDRVENSRILALLRPAEKEFLNDIKKAWICDWDKGVFRAIPVKGIDCLNEGYEQF